MIFLSQPPLPRTPINKPQGTHEGLERVHPIHQVLTQPPLPRTPINKPQGTHEGLERVHPIHQVLITQQIAAIKVKKA